MRSSRSDGLRFGPFSGLQPLLPLIALSLAFGLAGCGSGDSPQAPRDESSREAGEGTAMPTLESLGGTIRRSESRPQVDSEDWELPDPRAPSMDGLRVVYSQDNRGELEACGCPGAPTGGMARRDTSDAADVAARN